MPRLTFGGKAIAALREGLIRYQSLLAKDFGQVQQRARAAGVVPNSYIPQELAAENELIRDSLNLVNRIDGDRGLRVAGVEIRVEILSVMKTALALYREDLVGELADAQANPSLPPGSMQPAKDQFEFIDTELRPIFDRYPDSPYFGGIRSRREVKMSNSPEELREQILKILEAHEASGGSELLQASAIGQRIHCSVDDVDYHLEILERDGYVKLAKSFGGDHATWLTVDGKQHVREGPKQQRLQRRRRLAAPEEPEPLSLEGAAKLFIAYCHQDERLRAKLETHLSLLRRRGLVREWHDRKIGPGREWDGEIHVNLESAHIILLLISADFLNSDYCYNVEMKRALERHRRGEARVVPVILRHVQWKQGDLGRLLALPTDGKPITTWRPQDKGFLDVAEGINRIVDELRAERREPDT
jgi:hypothetical protein